MQKQAVKDLGCQSTKMPSIMCLERVTIRGVPFTIDSFQDNMVKALHFNNPVRAPIEFINVEDVDDALF